MSDRKARRNWLLNWISPAQATTAVAVPTSNSSTAAGLHRGIQRNIKSNLIQGTKKVTDYIYKESKASAPKTITSLQRLDSVGGIEPDQPRFSYPPTKTFHSSRATNHHVMGNFLQSDFFGQVSLETQTSNLQGFHSPQESSKIHTFIASLGHFHRPFTSLPSLDTIEMPFDKASSYPIETAEFETVLPCLKRPGANSETTKNKMSQSEYSACFAPFNCHKVELLPTIQSAFSCSDGSSTSNVQIMDYDPGVNEITIMSPECYNEVQNAVQGHQYCSVPADNETINRNPSTTPQMESENNLNATSTVNCNFTTLCVPDTEPTSPVTCKNPIIAHILGYESDCDSDNDERGSVNSCPCDGNIENFTSSCEDSDAEETKNLSQSPPQMEDPDFSTLPVSREIAHSEDAEEDTDEEECPWERITSCRMPWTCSRKRRQKPRHSRRIYSSSDYDSDTESSDDDSNEDPEQDGDLVEETSNPGAPSSVQSWTDQSLDSCFEETDVRSCSSDNEDAIDVPDTVTRPKCSNTDISFILGWSDDESDAENDVFFQSSDNEQLNLTINMPQCNKVQALSANRTYSDQTSDSSETPNTDLTSDSCLLWDYFMKCQGPFLSFQATSEAKPIKKSSSCPTLSFLEDENINDVSDAQIKDDFSDQKPTSSQNEPEEMLYKTPTKVRFCDKVLIHPMVAWSFAYRQARKGCWDRFARDRGRFKCRVANVEEDISWCFKPGHREKIFLERFC